MPYRNPREFCRKALNMLAVGRSVASLSADLGVSDQTIYNWRRQDQIDHGLEPGSTSVERAELRAVRRQIVKLETELTDQHWQIMDQESGVIDNVGTVAPLTVTDTHDTWIQENGNYVLSPLIQVR